MAKIYFYRLKRIFCPACDTLLKTYYYRQKVGYNGYGHFCPNCGLLCKAEEPIVGEFKSCIYCGASNPIEANYCKSCGKDIKLDGMECGHGWMDLGLSVLWSTETISGMRWNDTFRPHFFQWRDSLKAWTACLPGFDTNLGMKLVNRERDDKDVATARWGGKWRTPTKEEFEELISKCKWEKIIIEEWRGPYPYEFREIISKFEGTAERGEYDVEKIFEHTLMKRHALKITGPNGNHIIVKATGESKRFNFESISFWTSSEVGGIGMDHEAFLFRATVYNVFDKSGNNYIDEEKEHKLWIEEPLKLNIEPWYSYETHAVRPVMDKER